MRNRSFFFISLLSIVSFFACSDNGITVPTPNPPEALSCEEDARLCDLTSANNIFGLELFQTLHEAEPNDNIFISPFSISTAMTMTLNGAANQTYDDMAAALKVNNIPQDELNANYKKLLETLPVIDPQTKLKLANSIWPQLSYPVLEDFLNINRDFFYSEIKPVDFARSEEVIGQVNQWVEDNTEGLIKETLKQLPPDVVMLLINAIYFKGTWLTEFDKKETRQGAFYTEGGTTEVVDMMRIAEHGFPYFQNEMFQAIDLAYGDSIYSMSIFLPREGFQVNDIVKDLNIDNWETWISSFKYQDVEVAMPKFKMDYEAKLKPTLTDMGMGIAFRSSADFTKMIDGGGVMIDDVIHKSFIEVDEEGTEAAAVTVVIIVETSAPLIPRMIMDHPFLFVIRENQTNSILFMGKLMDPNG